MRDDKKNLDVFTSIHMQENNDIIQLEQAGKPRKFYFRPVLAHWTLLFFT
jgi:hypothetical protein